MDYSINTNEYLVNILDKLNKVNNKYNKQYNFKVITRGKKKKVDNEYFAMAEKNLLNNRLDKLNKIRKKNKKKIKYNVDDNANLFHTHQILTENWLDRLNSGWMDLASERVEMMKQANNIWAVRKKIESGEVQEDENGLLEMETRNFINNNEKINAIKHYRKSMREVYGKEVSLKEAKEYVDAVHTIIRQGK